MTKAEFYALLDRAASGDLKTMRLLAVLCFETSEAIMKTGNSADIIKAKEYSELGVTWVNASEGGYSTNLYRELAELTKKVAINAF